MTTPAQPDQPMPAAAAAATPASAGPPLNRPAAWTTLGAGIAIIVGSFLPWGSITAPIVGTITVSGTDGSDGWVTAAVGALVGIYGFASLRQRMPLAIGVMVALAGLSAAGIAVWKILDLRDRIADMRAEMAATAERDQLGIASAFADAVHARIGAGLWLLVAAGAAACVSIMYGALKR